VQPTAASTCAQSAVMNVLYRVQCTVQECRVISGNEPHRPSLPTSACSERNKELDVITNQLTFLCSFRRFTFSSNNDNLHLIN